MCTCLLHKKDETLFPDVRSVWFFIAEHLVAFGKKLTVLDNLMWFNLGFVPFLLNFYLPSFMVSYINVI